MKIKDLERLLTAHGIGKTKMDIVTRGLRQSGELTVAVRGVNAPDTTALFAAKVMIAVAGSAKGIAADRRLNLLKKLRSAAGRRTSLLVRLTRLLDGSPELEHVLECRIGRNVTAAVLIFNDGTVEQFSPVRPRDYSARLRVEGTVPGDLMRIVARLLAAKASVPAPIIDEDLDSDA